jgi:hypothetical protein
VLVLLVAAGLTVDRVRRLARFASTSHRLPRVAARPGLASTTVTAIVPVRDEAANIAGCVDAIAESGPDLAAVVVVDDASSDGTAAVVAARADARCRLLTSPGPRPGELGKPVACAAGAAVAIGEWLWFVDADVRVAPDLLRRLLAAAAESGADLVSAVGALAPARGLVGWLLPEVGLAVAARHDPARIADATDPAVFASGQCLLVRRSTYDAVGGHAAVSGEVVEDVALARLVKAHGGDVRLVAAFDGFVVDMYPTGRGMWNGLLRNTSALHGEGTAGLLVGAAAAMAKAVVPVLAVSAPSPRLRAAARRLLLAQLGVDAAARSVARQPVAFAVLSPAVDAVVVGQRVSALRRSRAGGAVGWRGRPVRPS